MPSKTLPLPPLPIDDVLPALRDALRGRSSVVLQAPPGAGKTTRVPLALLGEPWVDGRIVMLEPRRLAARAAARHMARLLDEDVGATVGYRVRLDTRVSRATRIEVVTEGILTRMLQRDPALDGTSAVIFDEFHERSLHADLGLALALQTQSVLRPELRLLVMSATLDGERVARMLGDAPVVTSAGRSWPVEVRWRATRPAPREVEAATALTVREAIRTHDGDVLVFLPGAAEIRRVANLLGGLPDDVSVRPLHGSMPPEAQDAAIAPSPVGRRKVVLATNIAETSLTIEGIRVVVDTGLARVPRFSPRTAMTRLTLARVSRASATQRCGRAGRLGPGVCHRLWPEHEHHHLLPDTPAEILDADLAPLALELAAAGVIDPAELTWLDPPPDATYRQARELLASLGALGGDGRVTAHGRRMAELPLHPRLAHMVLRARELSLGGLACDLAALLEERDVLRAAAAPARPDADVRLRVEVLRGAGSGDTIAAAHGATVDHDALRRVRLEARALRASLGLGHPERSGGDACGLLLALAYPDRVAQRRPGAGGRYLLANGRGATFDDGQPLATEPYVVAAELGGTGSEARVELAAPLAIDDWLRSGDAPLTRDDELAWDADAGVVRARVVERLGAIVLREIPDPSPDPEAVAAALVDAIRAGGLGMLAWSEDASRLRERLAFLHALEPSAWPDVSDDALLATLDAWLAPRLWGVRRRDELARVDVGEALRDRLTRQQRAALDDLAPSHVVVPSGSRVRIDYATPDAPVLAVRLQELFGAVETPRVGGGRVPLTLHLLSPAYRPVQVTRDLAGFWRTSYFDVRRELRGRYPKHEWPEDPLAAQPTARAKRRS
ncbi:ATP-dependent helicase HrpB [Gemmatirosa kalamazoonensis]|uniref:ATP-dependent helicase HrpB n=1 Tax=Gemmatirosa kalamazoonensis TaxID=861299 RepID=W0RNL8_9BACT|nr:ATP-dependent helicase HrpB [Gemmatirosa kalamazoonensis]AHG91930.1 ATP-dependent helicase HrpB [Gemmatirosa kalamazoonensis]